MKNKQNILLLTDVPYWKLMMGSHQRIFTLIEYLNLRYNLTIAFTNKKEDDDLEHIKRINHKVVFIDDFEKTSFRTEEIESFLFQYPVLRNFYSDDVFYKTFTFLQQNKFSHVIVEYIKLSYLLPLFKDTITILDTHDIMHIRNESFKKNNQKHWIDISEKEEIQILALYDKTICIQEVEYNYLIQKNINAICCPHPVKIQNLLQHSCEKNQIKKVIFIAGYSIANNISIKWFIDNVWEIFRDINNLQLNIYGEVSKSLKEYEKKHSNIILHNKIDDLSQAYENAIIAVNPVQMGGGLKIKNIEALAFGIPLITTTEGSKGIEKQINKSFLLANTKDQWIEKLVSLVISDKLRLELSKNSINFISQYFNNDVCFQDLIIFINKMKKI